MLAEIYIKDFAIISSLQLELDQGMTAVTGETGAGKSIVIDALSFAMGDKFDTSVIRHGQNAAEVSVAFEFQASSGAMRWLEEKALSNNNQCVIRRILRHSGRSQSYVNGQPVTLHMLKELSNQLIDIHGQHEHQSLTRTDKQRELLDHYANNAPLVKEVQSVYAQYAQCRDTLKQLENQQHQDNARRDLLAYQVAELNALSPTEGEFESLDKEHSQLANADLLENELSSVLDTLYESDNQTIISTLNHLSSLLEKLNTLDTKFSHFQSMLVDATITLQEAVSEMRFHRENMTSEPERLQQLDERMSTYQELSRKHRVEPENLWQHAAALSQELDSLDNIDERMDELVLQLASLETHYHQVANELSARRKAASQTLEIAISEHISHLNMEGGKFEVKFEPLANTFSRCGQEKIEFYVSANPGQPTKPLNKVASGGELSRISLAIQVILAKGGDTPCLIFDEVDVGIGGGTAEIVGRLLRQLGSNSQVLCVTHQGQVAAQAHHHLFVHKTQSDNATKTEVACLDEKQRVDEIARMIGGLEVTKNTKNHAKELLALVSNERAANKTKV